MNNFNTKEIFVFVPGQDTMSPGQYLTKTELKFREENERKFFRNIQKIFKKSISSCLFGIGLSLKQR